MDLEISAQEVKKKFDKKEDFLLIDVRELWENGIAHIKGSRLIPLAELGQKLKDLPKDKEIITHCHLGHRSMQAAVFLRKNGFNSRSMKGGIDAWSLQVDKKVPRY